MIKLEDVSTVKDKYKLQSAFITTGIDVLSTIDVEPWVLGNPIPRPIFFETPPPIEPKASVQLSNLTVELLLLNESVWPEKLYG